jgi:hypothetical protein
MARRSAPSPLRHATPASPQSHRDSRRDPFPRDSHAEARPNLLNRSPHPLDFPKLHHYRLKPYQPPPPSPLLGATPAPPWSGRSVAPPPQQATAAAPPRDQDPRRALLLRPRPHCARDFLWRSFIASPLRRRDFASALRPHPPRAPGEVRHVPLLLVH